MHTKAGRVFSYQTRELDTEGVAYLIARIVSALFVMGMYLWWIRTLPQVNVKTVYLAGAVLWALSSAVAVPLRTIGARATAERTLLWTMPADLIALGLLTASVGQFEDPFYAFYIAAAAVYATVFRPRRAWMFTGLFVASYLAAHLSGLHAALEPEACVFLVAKSGMVILLGWAVGAVMERQSLRARSLEGETREVEALNEQLERSVAEMRAISEITELVHSTLDFDSVGPTVLDILQKVLGLPAASMFVIDKAKQQTLFSASKGVPGDATSYAYDLTAGEVGRTENKDHFACMELLDHNQMLVVFCAAADAIDSLDRDDRMVLQAVASELVVAVENSRLYKLTKRLAITDELTDLHNYRYLQQRLDDEVGRAKRYGKTLSFLMLDVDDFKGVNDTHGHLVGDGVLEGLGRILKATVREVDVVARYGGEEFSVVLPETDAAGAFIVAEKVREAVSLHKFLDEDGEPTIHVTVSVGLANLPVHADDKESLLKAADDAVYHAKDTGKDRVRAPRIRMTRLGRPTAPKVASALNESEVGT
ncbi:MAG: GGDEF domain-containing protein [Coriobacteriia bacterium]